MYKPKWRTKHQHRKMVSEINRRYRLKNPERYKRIKRVEKILRIYGVTEEMFGHMLLDQNGVCAVCRQPQHERQYGKLAALHIDHNHETKKVRGLLCGNCNRALGMLQEDPLRIEALARYIRETNG